MMTSSCIPKQILIDVVIFILICIPSMAFYLSGRYLTNGFWCNDQSLSFPYKPDTVSQSLLLTVSFGAPLLLMLLTEIIRAAVKTKPRPFKRDLWSAAKGYGVFLFGMATNLLLTDSLKFSVGRLRPHFFDVCKPDAGNSTCVDGVNRKPLRGSNRVPDDLTKILLNAPCGNLSHYNALVLVHSANSHFLRRIEFRQTYGNFHYTRPYRLKVVFILGISKSPVFENLMVKENGLFRDTVQGNFVDAYRNLTYKALAGFRWASHTCHDVKLVIKMDDDVLFNVQRFFKEFWPQPLYVRNMIHCHGWKHPFVERHGKWSTTTSAYGNSVYPPYCSGFFVVIPPQLVHDFYRVGRSLRFLWIDDVFIYGIVRKKIGVQFVYMDQVSFRASQYDECFRHYGSRCKYISLVLHPGRPFIRSLLTIFGIDFSSADRRYSNRTLKSFISNYECTNHEIDHRLLRDAHLSFPSGHASFSMYSALFTIFYLQFRMQVDFSHLLKPVVQVGLAVAALLCCATRVSDNKHFPSDVAAGIFIGITVAWLAFYKIAEKVIPSQERERPQAIKRAISIESEPQTPTPLLRPERLVLNHHHLHHNGYRNGSSTLIKEDV